MERDARGDTRAAVGDELAIRKVGQRLVPRRVRGARNPARRVVDLVRLAAPAVRSTRVDEREGRISEATGDLLGVDRVATPLARDEVGGLELLLARAELSAPDVDPAEENGAVVVAEVPKQPPEALGTAHRAVRDNVNAGRDARTPGGSSEALRGGQRMPAGVRHRQIRQVGVHVEERSAGDVAREVELATTLRIAELPAAVDELVPQIPTTSERRSRMATSRQIPPISPSLRYTPRSRNPQDRWSRSDASFSGKIPALSVQ